jgi:hypothetical protein
MKNTTATKKLRLHLGAQITIGKREYNVVRMNGNEYTLRDLESNKIHTRLIVGGIIRGTK